jgi:hypothetical protein
VSSDTLVANLTRHSDKVLFSAATPGQGGENHINEQTPEFWRLLFAKRGYRPFDLIRPAIKGNRAVESWYRRNVLLYVAEASIPSLPPVAGRSVIRDDQAIPEKGSFFYRIQSRVLSLMPVSWASEMASIKHIIINARHSLTKK